MSDHSHGAATPEQIALAAEMARRYEAGDPSVRTALSFAVALAVIQHMAEDDEDHAIVDMKMIEPVDACGGFMIVGGEMCRWLIELGAGDNPRDVMRKVQARLQANDWIPSGSDG